MQVQAFIAAVHKTLHSRRLPSPRKDTLLMGQTSSFYFGAWSIGLMVNVAQRKRGRIKLGIQGSSPMGVR